MMGVELHDFRIREDAVAALVLCDEAPQVGDEPAVRILGLGCDQAPLRSSTARESGTARREPERFSQRNGITLRQSEVTPCRVPSQQMMMRHERSPGTEPNDFTVCSIIAVDGWSGIGDVVTITVRRS